MPVNADSNHVYSSTDLNWYCVHTKPKKEAQVARYCEERLGLEVYYPQIKQQKTIRRVKRQVVSPLFPRYFFSRFSPADHYRAVRFAPESLGLVTTGERLTIVDDSIINDLKSWAGEAVDIITISPSLQPGDEVHIKEGPFQGLRAVYLREMSDSDRVAILLSVLNSQARVIIDRAQITPAE